MTTHRKPTRAELEAAVTLTVPDVIAENLAVLFCGINPGLYSAAVGHHFARPGNRFWPALHQSGFTDRQLSPFEDQLLVKYGYGITNVVDRASTTAQELRPEEYVAGGRNLVAKVERFRPRCLAVLGVVAYRTAFGRPQAQVGRQPETIGATRLWVLPNPSGLNAHYGLPELVEVFQALAEDLGQE